MKTSPLLFLLLWLIAPTFSAFADSWYDPSWAEMLDSSDVIALVEYRSKGAFRAKASPLTIYKGQLKAEEIWISGFSNRYGPIDTMRPGDQYIVFLNQNPQTERATRYWEEKVTENPELKPLFEAYKAGNSYQIWTPTAGDLAVNGPQVQYDLLSSSYYRDQAFHSLEEFEQFLYAKVPSKAAAFQQTLLNKMEADPADDRCAQYLMMLQLTGFHSFVPLFSTIEQEGQATTCYALARLLGQVPGEDTRDLKVKLLGHENSLVQGEAVRQLITEAPEFIGPIFLSHLSSAGEEGIYPSNLMDPVNNQIDGGKIEIIRAFGQLKYKPAGPALLPLLETEEEYLFRTVMRVLLELENEDFAPYFNQHLENQTSALLSYICQLIAAQNLVACKPALMDFITQHDRNAHPDHAYSISTSGGLAHFEDSATQAFLFRDFQQLLLQQDTLKSRMFREWLMEHMEVCADWAWEAPRPLVYEGIFAWFGINEDFVQHPELFALKETLQDSLNREALAALSDYEVAGVESLVLIENTEEFGEADFVPQIKALLLIKLAFQDLSEEKSSQRWDQLRQARQVVAQALDLPYERIGSRTGSYVSNLDSRFETRLDYSPMATFYRYAEALPTKENLAFLMALRENGFTQKEFDTKKLSRIIAKIEAKQ